MKKSGIEIIQVDNQEQGLSTAKDILYKKVDGETLLFLSGGSTPKDIYETLAREKKLKAKAVGMADERMDRSNYEMIKATGLLDYFAEKKIPFYPILRLHPKGAASGFAKDYDKKIKNLLKHILRSVVIMGIGEDGHTAGLPASPKLQRGEPARTQNSSIRQAQDKNQKYVESINNFPGEFKERITLTFKALSEMDFLIILAFGENKKEALKKMFEKGPIEELPSRFYVNPDIAPKTLLITDQKI